MVNTDKVRILHAVKRLVKAEEMFNLLVDDLLDALGMTREEMKNDDSIQNGPPKDKERVREAKY